MTVQVEGRQFYWRYTYPNGAVSINELAPAHERPIDLVITAPAIDVIHSWWVPQLAGKMDAIPGKANHTGFVAQHEGRLPGASAPSSAGPARDDVRRRCGPSRPRVRQLGHDAAPKASSGHRPA